MYVKLITGFEYAMRKLTELKEIDKFIIFSILTLNNW